EMPSLGDDARIVAIDRAWKDGRARDALEFVQDALEGRPLDDVSADLLGWGAFIASSSEDARDEGLAARLTEELDGRRGDTAEAWSAIIEAAALMRSGDTALARERLTFALGLGRQDLAEFMLGQADLRVGDRRGAIARWRSAIERDPRWVAARMALAQALLDDGEIREAHAAALEALRLAPDRVLVAQLFARTSAALADADIPDAESTRVAIGALERIVDDERIEPGPSLALLARLKAADGDLQGAQEIIDRILRDRPEMSANDALALAGAIERRRLRGGEALLSGAEGIANDPAVLLARALKAADDGRVDEGKSMLRDAAASAPAQFKEPFERANAQFLDATGDPGALAAMRALSEKYPESAAAQADVLRSRSAWSDPELVRKAVANFRGVIGEQSPAWRVFEARRLLTFRPAETAKSGGDPTTANAAEVVLMLANVVRNDPGDAQAAALLAEAHLLLSQRDQAINALSAAVVANPGEPTLYPRLISLLQEKGDTAAAEQRLMEFLRIREVSTQLRRARVDLLLAQGMSTQALPELEQLAQSGDPDDLVRLAAQYGRLGRVAEATRIYEDLERIPNPTVNSVFGVAEYRLALGEVDRALAALDRLPDDVPEARKMTMRADLLERADRVEEATTLYERAAEEMKTGEAWLALSRHYVRRGMSDQAKAAIDKAYAASPNDPAVRSLAKGLALATGEEPPAGLEDVDADLGSNAEMRVLAAIQAFQQDPRRVDEYVRALRQIVSDFPRYFPARRLLVMAHAERGDWDAAIVDARDAARVLPIDAQPAQLLTEVYAARAEFENQRGLPEAQRQFTERALAAARDWRSRALGDPFDADVAIADLHDRLNNPREALRVLEPHSARLEQAGFA
ncbi:MAG: tetratricopeptide repeat protein, partial [Phycisphaerales bacterium]